MSSETVDNLTSCWGKLWDYVCVRLVLEVLEFVKYIYKSRGLGALMIGVI